MYGSNDSRNDNKMVRVHCAVETTTSLRSASTADIRASLCDLKMRPESQRRLLCRLLRRAAAQASTTDSAVHPVEAHHISTP